jgi:beta-glucosidase
MDLPSLSLPHNQDAIIAAVAAANPHTIVVLETGSPVTMPWVDAPAAILEAWYAGSDGANALGNVLFGTVNPSGKLPNTFPKSSRPAPPHRHSRHLSFTSMARSRREWAKGLPPFQVTYDEGLKVGYKWYDAEKKPVLFPFGYGLSYTTYKLLRPHRNSGCRIRRQGQSLLHGRKHRHPRRRRNRRSLRRPPCQSAQEPPKRLVGFSKVKLNAGEKQTVTIEIDPKYLSIFDEAKDAWTLIPGDYTIMVGGSSDKLPLKANQPQNPRHPTVPINLAKYPKTGPVLAPIDSR